MEIKGEYVANCLWERQRSVKDLRNSIVRPRRLSQGVHGVPTALTTEMSALPVFSNRSSLKCVTTVDGCCCENIFDPIN